jgi:hypothetical protein
MRSIAPLSCGRRTKRVRPSAQLHRGKQEQPWAVRAMPQFDPIPSHLHPFAGLLLRNPLVLYLHSRDDAPCFSLCSAGTQSSGLRRSRSLRTLANTGRGACSSAHLAMVSAHHWGNKVRLHSCEATEVRSLKIIGVRSLTMVRSGWARCLCEASSAGARRGHGRCLACERC